MSKLAARFASLINGDSEPTGGHALGSKSCIRNILVKVSYEDFIRSIMNYQRNLQDSKFTHNYIANLSG